MIVKGVVDYFPRSAGLSLLSLLCTYMFWNEFLLVMYYICEFFVLCLCLYFWILQRIFILRLNIITFLPRRCYVIYTYVHVFLPYSDYFYV